MLITFSLSLIIWKTATETWAQEMNWGGAKGAREQTGGPESWTVPSPWKLYFNPCSERAGRRGIAHTAKGHRASQEKHSVKNHRYGLFIPPAI